MEQSKGGSEDFFSVASTNAAGKYINISVMTTVVDQALQSGHEQVAKVGRTFLWFWVRSFLPQSFIREFRAWNTVSGKPNLWPLHGFSITIDVDKEDVCLLLVSPLATGDLSRMSPCILRNKDEIVTSVSSFTLRHIHCPSDLIVSDPGHCPWLEEFA